MSALYAQARSVEQVWSAVVLVDVTPRMELAGVARILAFMTGHPGGFDSLQHAADAIAGYNPHRPRSGSVEGLRRVLRAGNDGRWHWLWDPAFISSKVEITAGDPVAAAARMDRLAADLLGAARRLTVPTLLVRGGMSDLVSMETVKEFIEAVPHAEFVDVAGAGHMVAGDDNDVFTSEVVRFLEARA